MVMPENSAKVKIDAVKEYGAEITFCENNVESRQSTLETVLSETRAAFIHPFNNVKVIRFITLIEDYFVWLKSVRVHLCGNEL